MWTVTFFLPEMCSAIYAMIRTKLVPLITINYDSCSLTVLFSLASENNQRGIARPSRLCTVPSFTHAWIGLRQLLYAHDLYFLQSAVCVVMASCISAAVWSYMLCFIDGLFWKKIYNVRKITAVELCNNTSKSLNSERIQARWNWIKMFYPKGETVLGSSFLHKLKFLMFSLIS